MKEAECLAGIEKALDLGWVIEGSYQNHPEYHGLRVVKLWDYSSAMLPYKIGIGSSIEQAIYEANRAFCEENYRPPQLDLVPTGVNRPRKSALDYWVWLDGYFKCQKNDKNIIFTAFAADNVVEIEETGNSFFDALSKAFRGEEKILKEYLKNPPKRQSVIPNSVPYYLSPANPKIFVPETSLNSGDGCVRYYPI